MKTISLAALALSSFTFAQSASAQLLIDEAREAKNKTDRIMDELSIPTTRVDVSFPRSYVKAVLDQMIVDLPKIEAKVIELQDFAPMSVSFQSFSKRLFNSCLNKIKTKVTENSTEVPHTLVLIPESSGRVSRNNEVWIVEVTSSGPVRLAIQIDGRPGLFAETTFEVAAIPKPTTVIGDLAEINQGSASVQQSRIMAQTGLKLHYSKEVTSSCADFTPHSIGSFKLKTLSRVGDRSVVNTGANFSQARALLNLLRNGDLITIQEVVLQHPDQEQSFATNLFLEIR